MSDKYLEWVNSQITELSDTKRQYTKLRIMSVVRDIEKMLEMLEECKRMYLECEEVQNPNNTPPLTAEQSKILELLARTPEVTFEDVTVNGCEILQQFGNIGFAKFYRSHHGYWRITKAGRAALEAYRKKDTTQ